MFFGVFLRVLAKQTNGLQSAQTGTIPVAFSSSLYTTVAAGMGGQAGVCAGSAELQQAARVSFGPCVLRLVDEYGIRI